MAVAHIDRPIAAIGFLGSMLTGSGNPSAPYEIGLNFNWDHKYRKISMNDFTRDGNPTELFLDDLTKVDPKILTRRGLRGRGPFELEFREARSKRPLSLEELEAALYPATT